MVERVERTETRRRKTKDRNQPQVDAETESAKERLRLVRSEVGELMGRIFDTQPRWEENIPYYIPWPERDWKLEFRNLAVFFKDFADLLLEGVQIQKFKTSSAKSLKKALEVCLVFDSSSQYEHVFLEFTLYNNLQTKAVMVPEKTAGPARYYPCTEDKNHVPTKELIRLSSIKEILSWMAKLKRI